MEWNYSEARIGMELSSTNTQQILQFLQLQQQAGSISTTNSLGYDNSESPSSGPVFSTETFKGADTNNEVDSDNDFDEEFSLKKSESTHVFGTPSVGVTKMAPKSGMLGHSCADYFIKNVG